MTEKTTVGVTFFVADNTSTCGIRTDGAVVLLSVCSPVRCCGHQFIFHCLEVLLQGTRPPCTISCKALPGHSVDVDSLHISYADIFVSQVSAAGGSPPQCQLTVVFWNATIPHTADMTQSCRSLHCLSKVCILGRPTRDRTSAFVTLSCQDMPRIRRMLLTWNVLSLLFCPAYVVHD